MMDLLDAGAPAEEVELREHLAACPDCSREFEQMAATLAALTPDDAVRASAGFKERTLDKLNARLAAEAASRQERDSLRRPWWRRRWVPIAAAAALLLAIPYFATRDGSSGAVKLLAQSTEAMTKLRSVHMIGRMRTLPRDNFELIGAEYPFVPIEMWKQFSDPPKWRVEKPERVVVMDGTSSLLFFAGDQAARGGVRSGFVDWLMPLLDAETVLGSELAAARAGRLNPTLTVHEHNGARILMLSVARKAQGDFTHDWCRNHSINESDHTRIYTFDAATHRLTGLRVMVLAGGDNITVLEINEIRYNEDFDARLFTIDLPADVVWLRPAEELPTANRPLPQTPRDAALQFFMGMAGEDWELVQSVYAGGVTASLKNHGARLTVISVGEPFQSGLLRRWFVPYEIQLRTGHVKRWALALRNDNSAGRWVVDGGF
jgi:hypothetical protein